MMFTAFDESCMREAIALGDANTALARPNPSVGCLLVKNNAIIARGVTQAYGGDHAEQSALKNAGAEAHGATMYVTLEPCNVVGASGRAQSCCDSIIHAGIAKVFIAIEDENVSVKGKGIEKICAAGIEVSVGLLAQEARQLHAGFLTRMQRGTPYVRAKIAASIDGRTALANGKSQWITGEAARADGHAFRARACAVLVGSGTLRADNPQLTVRHVEVARQPLRVLVDHLGSLTPDLRVFEHLSADAPLVVAYGDEKPKLAPQVEMLALRDQSGKVDLAKLLRVLGERKINTLHLEAGARLTGAFIEANLVDELLIYLAPKLLGPSATPMFNLPTLHELPAAQNWQIFDVAQVGEDVRLRLRANR